jgi:hypothetical protein
MGTKSRGKSHFARRTAALPQLHASRVRGAWRHTPPRRCTTRWHRANNARLSAHGGVAAD